MIQLIITYLIIFFVVIYTIYKLYKIATKKPNKCKNCDSICDLKNTKRKHETQKI